MKEDTHASSADSLPKCLQQPGLCQTKARSKEFNPGLPYEWQQPKYWAVIRCLPRSTLAGSQIVGFSHKHVLSFIYYLLLKIYPCILKSYRETEAQKVINLTFTGSFPKWLQRPGLGQAKVKTIGLFQVPHVGAGRPSSGHLLSLFHCKGTGSEVELPGLKFMTIWGAGLLSAALLATPQNQPLYWILLIT